MILETSFFVSVGAESSFAAALTFVQSDGVESGGKKVEKKVVEKNVEKKVGKYLIQHEGERNRWEAEAVQEVLNSSFVDY